MLGPRLAYLNTEQIIDRLSPNTLYAETALALLQPATRALGPVLISQLQGALLGAPLPVTQSFMLIWPQLTGLDRRDDRDLRDRLRAVPAPGDSRVATLMPLAPNCRAAGRGGRSIGSAMAGLTGRRSARRLRSPQSAMAIW